MADEAYLNELVIQEADPLGRALLEQFAKIIRDENVDPADYPTRVRMLMDGLFNGLVDALNHVDGR